LSHCRHLQVDTRL